MNPVPVAMAPPLAIPSPAVFDDSYTFFSPVPMAIAPPPAIPGPAVFDDHYTLSAFFGP